MKTIAKILKHDFKKGHLRLYDSNGNVIYYEYSNGDWSKREYDSKGNLIYREDSDGYWFKSEYDSTGKLIYREYSDGKITDSRPKAKCHGKTVTIDGVEYELKEKK